MAISNQDPTRDANNQPVGQIEPAAPESPGPTASPPTRPRGHRGWLVVGLIALAAVVAAVLIVPARAPLHQLVAGTMTTPPTAGSSAAAIQAVIQQANQEQARALAQNNPTLMSNTATAAYYRELVQTNQQLAAQGATSISLVNLTWGAITVKGSTATASTVETWTTTFSDGSTSQATSPNVYTLVLQGGTWLISADQQPTASAAPGATAPSAQPTPPPAGASAPSAQNSSMNWSGYVSTSGTYTGVTGTWNIPQPTTSTGAGVGATWVGIGGVSSQDLIQAGTQMVSAGGQAQFQTWIELLPAASQQVPVAVVPGNSVTVSIVESSAGSGVWNISIKNNTTGQSYQTTASYTSSQSSAEWIVEAPASSGGILPLDSFNPITFSNATAIQNGQTVGLAQTNPQPITMYNANNQALAVPSTIGSAGSGFTVTRTSAPSTTGRGGSLGRRPGRTGAGASGGKIDTHPSG